MCDEGGGWWSGKGDRETIVHRLPFHGFVVVDAVLRGCAHKFEYMYVNSKHPPRCPSPPTNIHSTHLISNWRWWSNYVCMYLHVVVSVPRDRCPIPLYSVRSRVGGCYYGYECVCSCTYPSWPLPFRWPDGQHCSQRHHYLGRRCRFEHGRWMCSRSWSW